MRLTMLALGTRGDVVPYVALGLGLARAGHEVTLAAYADFEEEVRARGLGFRPVVGGMREILGLMDGSGGAGVEDFGNNPVRLVGYLRQILAPTMTRLLRDCLAACRPADAVVTSPVGFFGGYHVAESLVVPLVPAYPQPVHPTRHLPGLAFPAVPDRLPPALKGAYNLLTHHLGTQGFWQLLRGATNRARREVLGLPPVPFVGPFRELRRRHHPTLYGWSPAVLPKPPDWGAEQIVTGYWFLERPEGWCPPEGLASFLYSGPPPVYVGFGSMPEREPEKALGLILEAVRTSGRRAVLLSAEPPARALPETVYRVGGVPHDWLLPRVAAAVHHGGAGTTAAALRAGVPSVVVPFLGDQSLWASRVHALGAGPAPIPRKRLTAGRLAEAIVACGEEAIGRRAAQMGERLRAENGVAQAVDAIDRLTDRAERTRSVP